MTKPVNRYPASDYHLVVHTNAGRPVHIPGISGLKLKGHHMQNLKACHDRGHAELIMPTDGPLKKVVVKLPKMKA